MVTVVLLCAARVHGPGLEGFNARITACRGRHAVHGQGILPLRRAAAARRADAVTARTRAGRRSRGPAAVSVNLFTMTVSHFMRTTVGYGGPARGQAREL